MGVEICGIGTRLELWYPERGFRFRSDFCGQKMHRYDAKSPITGLLIVVPPGSIEEMIENWEGGGGDYIKEKLKLLKKWPENFTEVVLEK